MEFATRDALKEYIKRYWSNGSEQYDKRTIGKLKEETDVYRNALHSTLQGDNLKILDIGTGTGFLALMLAEMGHRVTGLDMTEGMMDKAKHHAEVDKLTIDFRLGDAESLPFDNGSFDAVVCRWVLWTLPDQTRALSEWSRVTKTGGQMLVFDGQWRTNTFGSKLAQGIKRVGALIYDGQNPWKYHYAKDVDKYLTSPDGVSPARAKQLFQDAGLKNIKLNMLPEAGKMQRKGSPLLYKLGSSPNIFLISGNTGATS
nr:class I SAM-dependent methyltransferase [Dehalococcoides mccartyi]